MADNNFKKQKYNLFKFLWLKIFMISIIHPTWILKWMSEPSRTKCNGIFVAILPNKELKEFSLWQKKHLHPNSNVLYICKFVDEETKNHKETDGSIITRFMPEIPNCKMCPVQSVRNIVKLCKSSHLKHILMVKTEYLRASWLDRFPLVRNLIIKMNLCRPEYN